MSRLWDRGEPLDRVVERFTVGRDPELDRRLTAFDALGSAAHAAMLESIGVLEPAACEALMVELAAIAEEARAGEFSIAKDEEDCHTAIENRLTAQLGEAGKRIHTGRSRNDQVIAALRLYGREAILGVMAGTLDAAQMLLDLAHRYQATPVAGYSHTRQAMPTTMGHFFGAHAEVLLDDVPWLQTAFAHLNRSPLGSASGFGVPLDLDRELVARLLRFDGVQQNTLAVQNDRGKGEYLALGAALAPALDLGRLAADLIWYSTEELGYISLGHALTTGSSIMPQKRNPDVLELIRAGAARLRSRQAEIGAVFGPLSSGYHRDLQLTKEPFLEGLQGCLDMLAAIQPVLSNLEVNPENCARMLQRSSAATDAVYQRVAAGEPFRAAYKEVAADPEGAVDGDPAEVWAHRTHAGAPGALGLDLDHRVLSTARRWLEDTEEHIRGAWELLDQGHTLTTE